MTEQAAANGAIPWFRESELFTQGAEGYHTFRIPCIVVANDGTILAFCEGRKHGQGDFNSLYLVLKRSTDNGATWGDLQVVVGDGDHITHNPTAVVDRDTGTVWLTFCEDGARVYATSSADSGASWSDPVELTSDVRSPTWSSYWTGPGHGVQLKSGRLVIPCSHGEGMRRDDIFYESHVFYSDDHGSSWQLGESLAGYTTECEAVETDDGRLYMAIRTADRYIKRRVRAWSSDGGESWSEPEAIDELPDPRCSAGIVRLTDQANYDKNRVIFSNINNPESRENLTVRVSYDECGTWAVSRVVYPGPSAYSDLAIAADMTICCFYERGTSSAYESIRLAQFNVAWLTDGEDHIV